VAVVDERGVLLSNISAKDIKVLKRKQFLLKYFKKAIEPDAIFTKLFKSAATYVGAVRAHEMNVTYPNLFCKQDDTVSEVIYKLSFLRVHRLYVVDDLHKPI